MRIFLTTVRCSLLGVAITFAAAGLSQAASSINVRPTTLELTASTRFTSLVLTNTGNDPLIFQIHTYLWSQRGDTDALAATNDLIVAPPVLSIAGGTSRTVRVALHDAAPSDREKTYRITVTQVPDRTVARGLQFIYQFSVPLFVAPAVAPETKLVWSAKLDRHKNRVSVSVANQGNVHVRFDEVRVFGGFTGTVPLGTLQDSGDVLAGATRVYEVPLQRPPVGQAVVVEASATGEKPTRTTVSLAP